MDLSAISRHRKSFPPSSLFSAGEGGGVASDANANANANLSAKEFADPRPLTTAQFKTGRAVRPNTDLFQSHK